MLMLHTYAHNTEYVRKGLGRVFYCHNKFNKYNVYTIRGILQIALAIAIA